MRLAAAAVVCATLVSCSASNGGSVAVSPSPAQTLAADLRTHLDLLLAEHVMFVAKESVAAVNHADDYDEYAALLAANASDLAAIFASAFGNTSSSELMKPWNAQDGYLVDYAIGVVTHDDAKAKAAMLTLTNEFVPNFAQAMSDASGIDSTSLAKMLGAEASAEKTFIDDYSAASFSAFYPHLHSAQALTAPLGDGLATQMTHRYPDRFPGDPLHGDVDRRVKLSLLLQEHAYLSTMSTDAVGAGRTADGSAAASALAVNTSALAPLFGAGFANVWGARISGLNAYARGDTTATASLTVDFVRNFAALAHVDSSAVSRQLTATLKVIDDQRGKDSADVAKDDRAAATAMEPIADAAS